MTFGLERDYSNEDLRAFENLTGGPADFTLSTAWVRAAENSGYAKGIRLLARRDGRPVAILQGILRSRYRIRKLLCGSTSGVGVAWQPGEEQAAVKCLDAAIAASRPQVLQVFSRSPMSMNGIEWTTSNSFQIRLDRPLDSILDGMEKRARHAARRAERLGVVIEEVPDPDGMNEAYEVVESAARERAFPVPPRAYSLALHREFASVGAQACFVARLGGRAVSAVSILGYGPKVAWWKGGSLPDGYRTGAGNAIQVAAIRWLHQRGIQVYDLGGTDPTDPTYAGIDRFKVSLGGTRTQASTGTRTTTLARRIVGVRRALRRR